MSVLEILGFMMSQQYHPNYMTKESSMNYDIKNIYILSKVLEFKRAIQLEPTLKVNIRAMMMTYKVKRRLRCTAFSNLNFFGNIIYILYYAFDKATFSKDLCFC